jgi:KipI family sensor histidine kinase inhibitor
VIFGTSIDAGTFDRVTALAKALAESPEVKELVPTFAALTIHYDPLTTPPNRLHDIITQALSQPTGHAQSRGRQQSIPVCFDRRYAPDLDDVASATGLSPQQVIETLCSTAFRVYMLGFLPGFPYMGGLPKALALPRRSDPRVAVPARSLAIAGEMCAIYPTQSPGGWHLLGRTPLPLFAPASAAPTLFESGDTVHFHAIDHEHYRALCAEAGLHDA